ncbi:hypothetical protein XENTR_v10020376 [Xenopus tropicalis]|nr:hypothetical protein XENTR_v10020376 [Xenopus tropicalis]
MFYYCAAKYFSLQVFSSTLLCHLTFSWITISFIFNDQRKKQNLSLPLSTKPIVAFLKQQIGCLIQSAHNSDGAEAESAIPTSQTTQTSPLTLDQSDSVLVVFQSLMDKATAQITTVSEKDKELARHTDTLESRMDNTKMDLIK